MCVLAAVGISVAEDFPRAVCRSSSSMCSQVDRQDTYGFIFLCGSSMCAWSDIELPRPNRHKHRSTLMETHSRKMASWPVTFASVHTVFKPSEVLAGERPASLVISLSFSSGRTKRAGKEERWGGKMERRRDRITLHLPVVEEENIPTATHTWHTQSPTRIQYIVYAHDNP